MKTRIILLLLALATVALAQSPFLTMRRAVAAAAVTTFGSINFDGTDDSVTIGTMDPPASMTLSMWIKPDAVDGISPRFFSKATSTVAADHWVMFGVDGATPARLRTRLKTVSNNTTTLIATSGTLTLTTWHHVAFTYNSSDGLTKIYLNATEVASGTHSDPGDLDLENTVSVRIGANGEGSNYFDGKITNVKIWSSALSAGDITSDHASGKAGNSVGSPIHRWVLDDGADTTSADGDTIVDGPGTDDGLGNDGANNTGLTFSFENL